MIAACSESGWLAESASLTPPSGEAKKAVCLEVAQGLRGYHFTGRVLAAPGAQVPQFEPQAPALVVCFNQAATQVGSGQRNKASFSGRFKPLGASVSRQYRVQPATRTEIVTAWKTSYKNGAPMVIHSGLMH